MKLRRPPSLPAKATPKVYNPNVVKSAKVSTDAEGRPAASSVSLKKLYDWHKLPIEEAAKKLVRVQEVHWTDGSMKTVPTISIPHIALLCGKSYHTYRRWMVEDRVPLPVLANRAERAVYHVNEAVVIAKAIRSHAKGSLYYRGEHKDTLIAMRNNVAKVRETLNLD